MTLGFCAQRIRECVNVDVFVHMAMPPASVCKKSMYICILCVCKSSWGFVYFTFGMSSYCICDVCLTVYIARPCACRGLHVRSRQGGASCEAVYVYEQMRAPQPHSHQSSNYQRKNITGQYGVKLHGWSHWFWGRKTEKNTRLFSKPTRSSFII